MKNIITILFGILSLLLTFDLEAQKSTISGMLLDSLGNPLINGTAVLLNPQDSVLEHFAISDAQGRFKIKNATQGAYIFQASYVGYQSFYQAVNIADAHHAMGAIVLKAEHIFLDGATVTAERIPILIKKDTIEYNAASFRTQPNDAVEDLLRKLPGVEVEKDGTIRAQGQEVQNITVDGKSFFGDDPTIASQNLPADAIDKVQVFDRKSEAADFTGVDDGARSKSINLALKEDKKKGVFGKVTAGYGSEDRYEGKANINRFNKTSQLSFLGRANNINEQGFSFQDYINFSGGLQNMMSENGSLELRLDANDGPIPFDFGQANYGFTNTLSGGLNFNHDFSKNTELQSSYFVSQIKKQEEEESSRQNFLANEIFPSQSKKIQDATNLNHRLSLNVKHKIDSTQVLRLQTNLNMSDRVLDRFNSNRIFNTQNELENIGQNDDYSTGDNLGFSSNLSYMRKLKKRGRSITSSIGIGGQSSERNNQLSSINQFQLQDPINSYTDSLLQEQMNTQSQLDYQFRFSYTEPIGKGAYLQMAYQRYQEDNESERQVYDIETNQRTKNELLSNQYKRDYHFDRIGLTYRKNTKSQNFSLGLQWQKSMLNGRITNNDQNIKRPFKAWLPNMSWQYNFSSSKNIKLNYRTNFREPSIEQLQPFVDNRNPLNLYLGNPQLAPEYVHQLNLQFVWFDQFSFTNFFANISGSYTQDKITNATTIDEQFRQTTQPINVQNDLNLNSSLSFGTPFKLIKSKLNINLENTYSQGILFINTIENEVSRWNTSIDISLENRKKSKVDILAGLTLGFNQTAYSELSNFDQNFSSLNYYSDLGLNFKKDWSINFSLDYTFYYGEISQVQNPVPILETSISKSFLKNKRGQITLRAVDLFNQGIGVERNSTFNFIEDKKIQSLGRYYMLSFTYALSAFGDAEMGGIEIKTPKRW